jgi:hypothetical protein
VRDNPAWQGLARAQYGARVAPIAFLHARTSPGGNRRLVAVAFGTVSPDPQWRRFVFIPCVATTSFTGLGNSGAGPPTRAQLELFRQPTDNLRVLDGQPDANDPSRFTIDLQINGMTYTIDGQLHDNDTVTLTPRGAPYVKYMNMVYWNPTGVKLFDWLSRAPGAATVQPATKPSATAPIN